MIAGKAFSTRTGSALSLASVPQTRLPVYTSFLRMMWTPFLDQSFPAGLAMPSSLRARAMSKHPPTGFGHVEEALLTTAEPSSSSGSRVGRFLAPSWTYDLAEAVGHPAGDPEATRRRLPHPPRDNFLRKDIGYSINTKKSGTYGRLGLTTDHEAQCGSNPRGWARRCFAHRVAAVSGQPYLGLRGGAQYANPFRQTADTLQHAIERAG